MGDTIFLYTALYTTSLLLIGLLLTMREFTRLNGRGRPSLAIAQPAERLPADEAYGYVLRYL